MVNLTTTISLLELIWVLIGNVGLTAHITLLLKCLTDKRIAIKYNAPQHIMIVANAGARRQVVYSIVQGGMIALGLNAMTAPPNPISPTLTASIGAAIIILTELFLIGNALTDHYDRNRLLAILGGRRVTDNS